MNICSDVRRVCACVQMVGFVLRELWTIMIFARMYPLAQNGLPVGSRAHSLHVVVATKAL